VISDKNRNTVHPDVHAAFRAESFSGTGSNDWYATGPGERNRTEVRNEFIANESLNEPDIPYTKVGTIDYRHLEKVYGQMLEEARIAGDDLFYEQVARKLAEMYRHKEVQRRVGGEAIDKALSIRRAEQMNGEIFGELEQGDFDVVLSEHIANAQKISDHPIARDFLQAVGDREVSAEEGFDFELKPDTITKLREDLFTILPNLESTLASTEMRPVDMDEAATWANRVIAAVGMDQDGWRSEKIPVKATAETTASKKLVSFGAERANFESTQHMNAVIVHEVVGHGYRAFNSARQEYPTKRPTMPGTTDFEEGLATGLEQLISGKPRIAGKRFILAFGLAKGLDRGGEPRGFRETYDLLYQTLAIERLAAGQPVNELELRRKAYMECSRTRRGGAIDMRDISYFAGAKKAYNWMNEIAQLPEEERQAKLRWILSGRFDPTNEAQAALFS
jgi:hypothetical protein